MIAAYDADEAPPAGYALDVGVLSDGETALVEVNDGYAPGYYGRVSPARACAYLELLAARYVQVLCDALRPGLDVRAPLLQSAQPGQQLAGAPDLDGR